MGEFVIRIDTREQRPFLFPEWVSTRVATLKTGDYAVDGDNGFAVERKSLDDLIGTVFTGWERFKREIRRMDEQGFPAKVILVEADFEMLLFREGDFGEVIEPEHSHVQITPQAVVARIAELELMGVQVVFCGSASFAALMCYHLLAARWKQMKKRGFLTKS